MDTVTVEHEEVVFKAMVAFAKEHNAPMIVHTPPPVIRPTWVERRVTTTNGK